MFLLLLITAVFSLLIGRFDISIKECFGILWSKLFPIEPYWTKVQHNMLVLVRLPRIIIAILVGASLSVAGTS
ncbi:MAG: iron chelate uptake ABC transporter family permease subunit, partial [Lachnospiraceae bacterium]|nr:iron chelate uptake ABC transporter family permease subunit [Lachnospiraceae bacterium]